MIEQMNRYVGIESLIPTVGIFALSLYFYYSRTHKKNYPPGPKGLPVLGCVTQLGEHPSNTLTALSKKYGNVFSIQIGMNNYVILNDYESIHEALLKKNDDFSGRPDVLLLRQMGQGHGIIFRDHGPEWKSQKKFAVACLRELGVGKKRLEDLILAEVNYLAEDIESRGRKAFNSQKLFVKATGNIVCELLLGSRMPYNNETYCRLVDCLDTTFFKKTTTPSVLALIVAPIVRFLPGFRDVYGSFCKDLDKTFEILHELLENHKNNFDDADIRDFVDTFLNQMKSKSNKDPVFKELQIFQLMRELFVAGSVNISVMLRWSILCFANHPEHQEKIKREVDEVIGEGVPSMKHREDMPYTCAFLQEILRHRTLVPLSMPHKTTNDTSFGGYEIPKDTPVLTNLWAVQHDPEHFADPEEFRPDRFLDEDGKFVQDSHVIPFSFGPRYCMGDQMAKIELFLFLTSIVQRFNVIAGSKHHLPSLNDGVFGVVYVPPDFEVRFESR
ncbi:cytochrome P450 2B1-like [Styela clava]